MEGDAGDNVPSFWEYYKNGKKVRITASKTKKICESLNATSIEDLIDAAEAKALSPAIETAMKAKIEDFDVAERLFRQRKLVELKSNLFPEEIVTQFEKNYNSDFEMGKVDTSSIHMQDILKDTKYLEDTYNKKNPARQNSIFDNMKDLEKYIKPVHAASLFD